MFKVKGNPRVLIGDVISDKEADLTATTGDITSATAADPVVATETSHGRTTGDIIEIADCDEMTELNGNQYQITSLTADTFSLQDPLTGEDIDGTGYDAETTGGTYTLAEADDGTVTMSMSGKECTLDFSGDWNIHDYDFADIQSDDYVLMYQTGETSDTFDSADVEWMYVPAADFAAYYIVEGC
jgi:hypothetical protein